MQSQAPEPMYVEQIGDGVPAPLQQAPEPMNVEQTDVAPPQHALESTHDDDQTDAELPSIGVFAHLHHRQRRERVINHDGEFRLRILSSLDGACVSLEFTPIYHVLTVSNFVNHHLDTINMYMRQYTSQTAKIQLSVRASYHPSQDHTETSILHNSTSAKFLAETHLTLQQFLDAQKLDRIC